MRRSLPTLEGHVRADVLRDFRQVVANLQLAYADAASQARASAAEEHMTQAEIGVFGGSGFYSFSRTSRRSRSTRRTARRRRRSWSASSAASASRSCRGTAARTSCRRTHPYRANVWAMRELGVRRIIGPNASGALKADLELGEFVVCDQFVDRTYGPRGHVLRRPGDDARLGRRPVLPRPAAHPRRDGARARHPRARRRHRRRHPAARASRPAPSRAGSRTPAGTRST